MIITADQRDKCAPMGWPSIKNKIAENIPAIAMLLSKLSVFISHRKLAIANIIIINDIDIIAILYPIARRETR